MPFLSVIIPVYNVEDYLYECMGSLVCQDCKDIEIIVIDDGSTDSSLEVLKTYSVKFPFVQVVHIDNSGVSHTRNIGLEHANGEWISFVDADDWIESDYVESLQSIKNSSDIIFFGMSFRYEGCGSLQRLHDAKYVEGRDEVERTIYDLKYGAIDDMFGWTWCKFFKRSIIEEHHIRFDENIKLREDEMFTMEYCRYVNSIQILDKALYNYRILNTGLRMSGQKIVDNMLLAHHMVEDLKYFHNEELLKEEKKRIIGYYIEDFKKKESFRNMYPAMREIYSFLRNNPEYGQYTYDQQLISVMSHSKLVSDLLLEIRYILMGIFSRIK